MELTDRELMGRLEELQTELVLTGSPSAEAVRVALDEGDVDAMKQALAQWNGTINERSPRASTGKCDGVSF